MVILHCVCVLLCAHLCTQRGAAGTPTRVSLPGVVSLEQRSLPSLFTVYEGETWVVLHRSLAEYLHHSPDNNARTLLAYFR
jgi:hypothetical protein